MGIQQKCARYHKEAEKGQKTLKKNKKKNKKGSFHSGSTNSKLFHGKYFANLTADANLLWKSKVISLRLEERGPKYNEGLIHTERGKGPRLVCLLSRGIGNSI